MIFQLDIIPHKLMARATWDYREGWCVSIEGETYFAFRTREDAERAMLVQSVKGFKKTIFDDDFDFNH